MDGPLFDSPTRIPGAGRRLGRYLLQETLGKGGMGVVWRARDTELNDRPVALKFLPDILAEDDLALVRLKHEAEAMLVLTHPGIVRLYNFERQEGLAFLAMECLDGPTLRSILARRAEAARFLSAAEALWVLEQAAAALDHAHAAGVLHRDIKPSNIMLDRKVEGPLDRSGARVKVADFGIAYVASSSVTQLTGGTDPAGTPAYMAPELLAGDPPSRASDIYALGATLFELVRGRLPFHYAAGSERDRPTPPADSGDPNLDRAVALALCGDPGGRPATASELLRIAAGQRARGRGAPGAPRRKKAPLLAVALCAVALGGGGVLGWKLLGEATPPAPPAPEASDAPEVGAARSETQIEPAAPRDAAGPLLARASPPSGQEIADGASGRFELSFDEPLQRCVLAEQDLQLSADGRTAAGELPLPGEHGEWLLSWRAVDLAGNESFGSVAYRRIDTSAPTFQVVEPAAGQAIAAHVATVSVVAADLDIARVRLGERDLEPAGPGNWSLSGVPLPSEGENLLEVEALDAAGNRSALSLTVVRDTRGPRLAAEGAVTAQSGVLQRQEVELVLRFDETLRGLAVEGIAFAVAPDGTAGSGSIQAPAGLGPWTPRWTAVDLAGNESEGSLAFEVLRDPWGDAPASLRAGFEVLEPAKAQPDGRNLPASMRHQKTGLEFVFACAGEFELGSPAGEALRYEHEGPCRTVRVSGFYIARTETTREAWRRGQGDAGPAQPGDEEPVTGVSWTEARAWCARNGLELPAEAQWEYAASGPENRVFPWGDVWDAGRLNASGTHGDDRFPKVAPAGLFPRGASWCGALDLAGNVMEWCLDEWAPSHAAAGEGQVDPGRTGASGLYVLRGGAWDCQERKCRTAHRGFDSAESRIKDKAGFRAVKNLE
ncbi:MAG: SUMF1/EgtB/PvdO family nonheme iron enzyme [Planctomycetes bacterium]|nr:SUMF1/EgtB/PvdO family nonheme iron enzyme [Planctomycetota bacterium]